MDPESAPPHVFLTTLLPLLFSPSPAPLPPRLLSTPLSRVHTYLHPGPASPAYLQLLPSEAISELHNSAIETGDWEPGQAEWRIDKVDGVLCRIPVGTKGLVIVLLWEEEQFTALPPNMGAPPMSHSPSSNGSISSTSSASDELDRPSWTFHTLAIKTDKPPYYPSLQAALVASPPPSMTIPLPTSTKPKSREDMAEGEGTTPGAYGAPEDFWEGWTSDADDDERSTPSSPANGTSRPRSSEQEDDDSYWNSYGGAQSPAPSIGEEDEHQDVREAVPPLRPKSATRSRRSSTIRAPFASTMQSPNGLTSAPASRPTSPEPRLSDGEPKKGGENVDEKEEALRFALAGVWSLYSRGASGKQESEEKKRIWRAVAEQVLRS